MLDWLAMRDKSSWVRVLGRGVLGIVLAYLVLVGAIYGGQRQLQYVPDRSNPSPATTAVPEMTEIQVRTADGLTNESWIKLPDDPGAPVIVMFHGNAENIGVRDHKARGWLDAGFGVMLVEYRGYGGNSGAPTEEGLMMDARAAITTLRDEYKVDATRMVFYGESLGSGVAVRMATEFPDLRGLVLEVPFDSALDVARGRFPFIIGLEHLMHDPYRSDLIVGQITVPKLILLAGQDRTVPPQHGQRLYDLAQDPKQIKVYQNAGHNNLYDHGAGADVVNFVRGLPTRATGLISGVSAKPLGAGTEAAETAPLPAHPVSGLMQERITLLSAGITLGVITAEVAAQPRDLERGLMGRTELGPDQGMLFILPQNMIARFWMRDTLIPLDMIFIDQDGRIINIHENAQPRDETSIRSTYPVRAVLELPAFRAAALGLNPGDLVLSPTLDTLRAQEGNQDAPSDETP